MLSFTDKKLLKELIITLVVKLMLLFVIWYLFFSEPDPTDTQSLNRLFTSQQQGATP